MLNFVLTLMYEIVPEKGKTIDKVYGRMVWIKDSGEVVSEFKGWLTKAKEEIRVCHHQDGKIEFGSHTFTPFPVFTAFPVE